MSLSRHFQNLAPGQWVAKGAIERDNDERPGITLELSADEVFDLAPTESLTPVPAGRV